MKHISAEREAVMSDANDLTSLRQLIELQKERESLRDRYNWLKAMIDQVPDFIYAKDKEGRFLFANRAVVENNGFADVEDLIGLTDAEIHPQANANAHNIDMLERRVMQTGEPSIGGDERRMKGNGWLMMSRVPLRDHGGEVIGVVGASQDITARKRSEEFMSAHARLLQDVAIGCDPHVFLETTRSVLSDLLPGEGADLVIGDAACDPASVALTRKCRSAGKTIGLIATKEMMLEPGLLDFLDGLLKTVTIAFDRHHDMSRVAYLAQHDVLTGLPNRSTFERALEDRVVNSCEPVAVAFLDLDHFKLVNDNLGHAQGDELLTVVADRITSMMRSDALAARIGGDEFVFILPGAQDDVLRELGMLLNVVERPLSLSGVTLQVTASVGVAFSNQKETVSSDLLACADMALYQAKAKGRNGVVVFSQDMADAARDKLRHIEELRRAIASDQFVLFYQPQIESRKETVVGVEVLVRWQHPTRGLLSPVEFIPLAEETGLIVDIDSIVMKKACRQLRSWLDEGFAPVRAAVNVSARQFADKDFIERVSLLINEERLDPSALEIEITEGLIMADPDQAITVMTSLKKLGVGLSIDDFGTGYSSLSMLKRFPISRLKIDRSFLANVPEDRENMAITEAIIGLAKTLKLEVIAEGVEEIEQIKFLRTAGCEVVQGFYYSKPVPAEALVSWLPGAGENQSPGL